MIGTIIDALLNCFAMFSAIADFPEPQAPWIKISFVPLLMAFIVSCVMSACVLLFENFSGSSGLFVVLSIESDAIFLYSDHSILFLSDCCSIVFY